MKPVIGFIIAEPGVGNKFLDLAGVFQVKIIDFAEISIQHNAPGNQKAFRIVNGFGRQIPVRHVIADTASPQVLLVEAGNSENIRNQNLIHKDFGLIDFGFDKTETLNVDHAVIVQIDGSRNPAHRIIGVRILAAENGMDFDDFLLPIQRFNIMRHPQQIDFRRKLIGRVSPVGIGKDTELATVHQVLDFGLDIFEVAGAG
jgi:hypothetical protein